MEEGYDVECVGEVSDDLFCMICLKLMKNAVFMKCGHGMCKTCFNRLCTSCEERDVLLQCPSCRKQIYSSEVSSVPVIDRIISGLTVKCENSKHGCSWTGEISTMKAHVMSCEYSLVLCPEEPCPEMVPKCMVQDHLVNTCLHSRVHCIYHSFGCGMKIVRQDMNNHLTKYSTKHLQLASDTLLTKEKEIEALTKENQLLKCELQQTKQHNQEINKFQMQLQNANEEHKKLSIELENSISEVANIKENLKKAILKLEKVDQHHWKSEVIDIEPRNISEKEVVESLKIALLKKKYATIEDLFYRSREEYSRLAKCFENKIIKGMDSLPKSVHTGMKFSSSYWNGFKVSFKHWFKEGILNQFQHIQLCCEQLQYLQSHEIKDLIPPTKSIKIGDYHYVKLQSISRTWISFESPCNGSAYWYYNGILTLHLPNADEVSLCSFVTLECISSEKIEKDSYTFHVKDGFQSSNHVLIKIKTKY